MNELFVARQIAHSAVPAPTVTRSPFVLLTDGEWLSCGHDAAVVARLGQEVRGRPLIVESLLPGVRTLAVLFAARRSERHSRCPGQLSDAADWMAARLLLLGISRVALGIERLPVFDLAVRRIRSLTGIVAIPEVLPMLGGDGRVAVPSPLLSVWSDCLPDAVQSAKELTSVLDSTLRLQQHLRERTCECIKLFA
ncbi:hypothetical protein [Paludibacterium paludis]|uniref:Uncharacterized protein n=1 Tax=Paludibacterium paludis TaxID=1225769 RepID=A0A918NZG3_9NEIS|nr:hypothetical protein [Paludibacterium paludis]GGY08606.1 hypothetical protein GCM10011289_09220 [Paludibacterium paludis]